MEELEANLLKVFEMYCQGSGQLEGKGFAKIAKDCKTLVDGKHVTYAEVDLAFTKVKGQGERKIGFQEFLSALDILATRKGQTLQQLSLLVTKHCQHGPKLKGTKAQDVRFHDDKASYTGVHAHGGPSTVDKTNPATIFGYRAGDVEEHKLE